MERFSLKTNWRLAETLCTTKTSELNYAGKAKKLWVGTCALAGDSEKKKSYMGGPYQEGERHLLGTPAMGPNTQKMSPLSWLEDRWEKEQGCRKAGLH